MNQLLAIAGGGAIGALLRYWVSNATYTLTGSAFPYGTLLVNVTGSLVMGFAYIWLLERMLGDGALRAFLLIGLLGAFTTFSTFSIETLNLIEQADYLKAVLNMLISVLACVAAAWIGRVIGRQL